MQPKTLKSLKAFLKKKIPAFNPISKRSQQTITFSPFSGLPSVSKRMRNHKPKAKLNYTSLEKENINLMQSGSNKKYEINGKLSNILNHPLKSSDRINSLYQKMKNKSNSSLNLPMVRKNSGLSYQEKEIKSQNENKAIISLKEKSERKPAEIFNLNINHEEEFNLNQKQEGNKEEENLLLNSDEFITNESPKASSIKKEIALKSESISDAVCKSRKNSESSNNNNNFKFNLITNDSSNDKSFLSFKRTRDELLLKSFNNCIKSNSITNSTLVERANTKQKEQESLFNSPSSQQKSPSHIFLLTNKSLRKLSAEENFMVSESNKNYYDYDRIEKEIVNLPVAAGAHKENFTKKINEISELFKFPSRGFDWNKLMNLTNLPSREFNIIKNCVCFKKYSSNKVQFILLKTDELNEYGLYFKIDPIKRKYYIATKKINREHHEQE